MKRIINDFDHYVISKYLKDDNKEELIKLQELMIDEFGDEKCLLHSDLEKHNHKEPIKFPFVKNE